MEAEWVCKYVFIHPISSPTTIIWGHGEKIVWKEKLYGDLMVRHLVHKYLVPIPLDNNVGFSFIFDSEEGLREYIDKRSQDGNIKEGSLRLTFNGAYQLGILILDSLIDILLIIKIARFVFRINFWNPSEMPGQVFRMLWRRRKDGIDPVFFILI